MADFTIDDFLINPTIAMEGQTLQTAMLDDKQQLSSIIPQHDQVYNNASESKAAASITDLIDEPALWYGYASEEEAASPVEDDNLSLRSFDSLSSAFSLDQASEACTQAQAVKFQLAGKATILSMPKIIDIPARRGVCRPVSLDYSSTRIPYVPVRRSSKDFMAARTSQDSRASDSISSRNNSMSSTDMLSPASTAPTSVDEEEDRPQLTQKRSFSRHVPLMEAARVYSPITLSSAPSTPVMPRSATFGESSFAPPLSRTSIRSKTKLPSISTFTLIGKTFNRRNSLNGRADLESFQDPQSAAVTPIVSQPPVSIRTHRPKMIARAANERAPPIVLPRFPGGEDDDDDEWPLKSNLPARQRNLQRRMIFAQ